MRLVINGLDNSYNIEHTLRIFAQHVKLAQSRRAVTDDGKFDEKLAQSRRAEQEGDDDLAYVRINARGLLVHVNFAGVRQTRFLRYSGAREYAACRELFLVMSDITKYKPHWGMLTGVRPVRILNDGAKAGKSIQQIKTELTQQFFVSEQKVDLLERTAEAQQSVIAQNLQKPYSLYISVPFCPSRCSYCSFVSQTTASQKKLVDPYVVKLCEELAAISQTAKKLQLNLQTIYIGGGTPTALNEQQLEMLLAAVQQHFDVGAVREYTVEAGRPDCTNEAKLALIKKYGAKRVSVNPQTFNDAVLQNIGRNHTAQQTVNCYNMARSLGFSVNMDLIAGLPGDTPQSFEQSLKTAIDLAPENITIHTLALKRASNIVIKKAQRGESDVEKMLESAEMLLDAGYSPYYLYRQKNTLQNLENVGYTKSGHLSLYNVYIMEEQHTIIAAGAGGVSKLVDTASGRIERVANHKYPLEYINNFQTVLNRKKHIEGFYDTIGT